VRIGLAGDTGDRHQAAHALGDLIESRPRAIGAVLAETGNAGEDDARIDRLERLVIDAEAELDVGAIVFDYHVRLPGQAGKDFAALGQLEVQRHRALVAVQILKIRAVARPAHTLVRVHARRRFDLDHVRAKIGELLDTGRAGANARQVEHAKARECT
jgi:hypothetical protein